MNLHPKIAMCTIVLLLISVNVYAASSKLWSAPVTAKIVIFLNPDYDISASPSTQNVSISEITTYIITITSMDNFAQTVQLNVTGAPSGITTNLNPEQVTPPPDGSSNSTLTVSANAAAMLGRYQLNVTGTNGTLAHYVGIFVGVIPEFPSILILPLLMIGTLLSAIMCKRKCYLE